MHYHAGMYLRTTALCEKENGHLGKLLDTMAGERKP